MRQRKSFPDFLNMVLFDDKFFKVVICGKYINLNKIIKNLTYLPEFLQTSYFCSSLQFTMQNRGTYSLKKCFNTEMCLLP